MELLAYLKELGPMGPFVAKPIYARDGDVIAYLAKDVSVYAVWIDAHLTIFRSMEDDSLVGCEIRGVREVMSDTAGGPVAGAA